MKEIMDFFARYKQARHGVYLADWEQRRILRLHFFTTPEAKPNERETTRRSVAEEITEIRPVGDRVEISTTGCDTTGPRKYLLRKVNAEWRIEKLFLTCYVCKGETGKNCTMCGGTGLWQTNDA